MKFFTKIKQLPRKALLSIAALIVLAGVPVLYNVVKAEFYPNRVPFDYNKPCNPNDSDPYDRCGSLTGPVFNSFINTPSYGDERAFADARRTDQTAAGSYKNVLENVTEGSKEVIIRTYVHNNANQTTNASGQGVARNTKVRVFLPTAEASNLRARSYISADNATPALVEDTVDLVGNRDFKVEYIPGSARMVNNQAFQAGVQLSDSIVTTGALIGDDALDGNLPGCFEYEAIVEIKVRIVVPVESDLQFTKKVRKQGDSEWTKEVRTRPGDKVEWLLSPAVTGNGGVQNNVIVRDRGVPNNQLETGSVKWIDSQQGTVPQSDGPLFDGGINFGNYGSGGSFHVMFTTTVQGNFEGCEARVRNLGYVKSDQTPEIEDHADVIIVKENCNPPTPVVRCDSLQVEKLGDQRYKFTVRYTAENATFKNAKFDFGDETTPLLTDKTTVEHTYQNAGTYVANVMLTFDVNGQEQTVSSDACTKPVTVPVYQCDLLTAKSLGSRRFSYTVRYTAQNGATFKSVSYNFGDNTPVVTTDKTTVEHTYAKDGQYTTKATVTFMVDGKEVTASSDNCATTVDAKTPPKYCPIPGKTHLPENSPECKENKYCPIPGKTNLPVDSPECVIPNTGAGEIIGLFAATTVAGAAAHYVFTSRRYGQ